jgi:hypothetical protein
LNEAAHKRGIAPEALALKALRDLFLTAAAIQPQDEWERKLLELAKDCGGGVPSWALRREAIYE